jgi:hypothetical protein
VPRQEQRLPVGDLAELGQRQPMYAGVELVAAVVTQLQDGGEGVAQRLELRRIELADVPPLADGLRRMLKTGCSYRAYCDSPSRLPTLLKLPE